jgi:hypothetical protein
MANLASAVWQDGSSALLLGVHSELAPSEREWDQYCSWIPGLLRHPNGACVVLTDGGAPSSAQRDFMRKHLGNASRWTAVITDKALVRGVVTAIRWFNPKVCAFAPWEFPEAFKFVGVSGVQARSVCDALSALDQQLIPQSRVFAEALKHIDLDRPRQSELG